MKMEGKLRVSILILTFILVSHLPGWETDRLLWAEESSADWTMVESQFFTIFCPKELDMEKIHKRINTRFVDVDLSAPAPSKRNPEKLLAYKFDLLLKKVEAILDMYPRGIHIRVKICQNQEQLPAVGKNISGMTDSPNSFYIHRERIIYTTVGNLSEKVLCHEIAHAVIDHYFVILPPRKIQELLAMYVETHLED